MQHRTVFFVSDQTGVTAETLGHSLITQFDGHKFNQVTLPFLDTVDKIEDALEMINLKAREDEGPPIIFSTLVQEEFREIFKPEKGLLRASG